jgi:pullulanase
MKHNGATGILWAFLATPAAALPPPTACDAEAPAAVLQPAPPAPPLEARAVWLDASSLRWPGAVAGGRYHLYHSASGRLVATPGARVTGSDTALELAIARDPPSPAVAARFRHVGDGITLSVPASREQLRELHRGQLLLVEADADGRVIRATRTQSPGALDDLYAAAEQVELGVSVSQRSTSFALWAPTAREVSLCLYDTGADAARSLEPMARDPLTGTWTARLEGDLSGRYYAFLVEVQVDGLGLVRNRVTDPYSISLATDSRRSYVASLDSPALQPPGWDRARAPERVRAPTDAVIYELHVRDFSVHDDTVPQALRGRYLAFTQDGSDGMRHLRRLAAAGVTDVHLLPVFDFATVPEQGCVTPAPSGPPDGTAQQAAIAAVRTRDCFNWGYDPLHFTAPEGSYASTAADGAARILEFRHMVQALHRAGLRVGMDVVYNHTYVGGQDPLSVLDRIVPGYYHRLDAAGRIEESTCGGCANTATEHRMMAKLMIDSTATWAREYRIDSFRFDLMGHQPRGVMERLQAAVDAAAGRPVLLLGEGWNFGEVADGARFVQASQRSLAGSGIATFSDRARDAIRGGGYGDTGLQKVARQGFVNGLHTAPNGGAAGGTTVADLLRAADVVRVGLAGSLRSYALQTFDGTTRRLEDIRFGDGPAGYVAAPGEVVNYVENHDNETLYDINAWKLPLDTPAAERARVQVLAAALTAFSQGIAYFHAGVELLRSKSMDRNSYDSGDWFNRIDWTARDNHFGTGLPPAWDNEASWPMMRPRLANPRLKPSPADIAWTRDAVEDLLRIRSSSTLFRLRTAAEVESRLTFLNTGPGQVPAVIAGHLGGDGYPGARFRELLYLVNVDTRPHRLPLEGEKDKDYVLHPAHRAPGATDRRAAEQARYDAATGNFVVPARTAVVFVVE